MKEKVGDLIYDEKDDVTLEVVKVQDIGFTYFVKYNKKGDGDLTNN